MEIIQSQLLYVLSSFLWGIFLLFIYDWVRILRLLIPHNKLVGMLEDLVFWGISSLLVFRMIYERNNGLLRGFFVVAILGGMYAYYTLAGDRFSTLVASGIHRILRPFVRRIAHGKKVVKKVLKTTGKQYIIKHNKLQR